MFDFSNAEFRYEPYPIGFARNVLPDAFYLTLAESFPPSSLMRHREALGEKFLLTEWDGERYYAALRNSAPWRRLYDHIKSREFVTSILDVLVGANIDLDLHGVDIITANKFSGNLAIQMDRVRRNLRKRLGPTRKKPGYLSSRFEFSALPGNGGFQYPHTDEPRKVISLVLYMMMPGEWKPEWGGGTAVCKPKDTRKNFNYVNQSIEFDETEVIESLPFEPNACVIFIKTFNSWHGVMPTKGDKNVERKSIAINIDYGGLI